jgi:putative exosortase-associated protein (TIGR04073 family)
MATKRILSWLSILTFILFLAPNAQAEGNYFERTGEKISRGLYNIVFSPFEISKAIESEVEEGQPFKTVTIAPAKGVFKMAERILVGSYETVTFLIPQDPIFKTPYITPSTEDSSKGKHDEK